MVYNPVVWRNAVFMTDLAGTPFSAVAIVVLIVVQRVIYLVVYRLIYLLIYLVIYRVIYRTMVLIVRRWVVLRAFTFVTCSVQRFLIIAGIVILIVAVVAVIVMFLCRNRSVKLKNVFVYNGVVKCLGE